MVHPTIIINNNVRTYIEEIFTKLDNIISLVNDFPIDINYKPNRKSNPGFQTINDSGILELYGNDSIKLTLSLYQIILNFLDELSDHDVKTIEKAGEIYYTVSIDNLINWDKNREELNLLIELLEEDWEYVKYENTDLARVEELYNHIMSNKQVSINSYIMTRLFTFENIKRIGNVKVEPFYIYRSEYDKYINMEIGLTRVIRTIYHINDSTINLNGISFNVTTEDKEFYDLLGDLLYNNPINSEHYFEDGEFTSLAIFFRDIFKAEDIVKLHTPDYYNKLKQLTDIITNI